MNARKAGLGDLELLIKLRIDYLTEEKGLLSRREQEDIEEKLRVYLQKWIPNGGFMAFVAEEDGSVCSSAFLSVVERPPRTAFSSYLVGTVYNVFTYPEHRRKGAATRVMDALLEEARLQNIASVDLLATADGKPLYEKLGFKIAKYTPMQKKIIL